MAGDPSDFVQAELHTLPSQGYSSVPTCLSPTLQGLWDLHSGVPKYFGPQQLDGDSSSQPF